MKLVFCPKCSDVVKFGHKRKRKCKCGKSWGKYLKDGWHAEYGGYAVPVGLDNFSLVAAIKNQPDSGLGKTFEAFIIPKECATAIQKKKPLKGSKIRNFLRSQNDS